MASEFRDSSRPREFRRELNGSGRSRLLVAILPILAGLALLGFFHWKSGSERQRRTASQLVPSVVESSVASKVAPPVVKSSAPSPSEMREPVKLSVTPSAATYPLGESSVLFVTMAGMRALSRGVVTLVYDPAILEVTSVHPARAPTPFSVSPYIENLQGWVSVSLVPTGARPQRETEGGLFTVEFEPIAEGRSEVVLVQATFTDARGSSVPVELSNGEVEVAVPQ